MKTVERLEDMSPRGKLKLLEQRDGDVIVCVVEDINAEGPCAGLPASVEFCVSGGKSPRTIVALRALMVAMAEDNLDAAYSSRRGLPDSSESIVADWTTQTK